MKQFDWLLLCVAETCAVIGREKSRHFQTWLKRGFSWNENLQQKQTIELRNLQILYKILKKSSQFLSSDQPYEPKSFDVALKIAGVEKVPSENLWLRPGGHLIRVLNELKGA